MDSSDNGMPDMKPKPRYKKVRWMFDREIEIPEEWQLSTINQIATVHGRIGWKNLRSNEYVKTGFPMLSVWSLVENSPYGIDFAQSVKKLTQFRYDESPEIQLHNDDVLVAKDGDIGRIGFIKKLSEPATVNSHVVIVRTNHKSINPEFLYWFLKSKPFQTYCKAFTSGTTVPLFTQKDLRNFTISLPMLSEQARIASILSGIDALIQSTGEIIKKTEKLKMGLMQELLTRGIGHKKFKKVPWLFGKKIEIPEEWELRKIDEIGQLVGGGTPDTTNKEFWNGDILWAVPTDITKLQTNLIEDTERKITKYGLENSSANLLPNNTILITSRATIGECAITTKPISTNQGFQSIICNYEYNYLFIFYLVKHNRNGLLRLSYGTTFLEISKRAMKKISFPIPKSIQEQTKIASILSGVDAIYDLFILIKARIVSAIFLTLLKLSTL